MENILEIEQLCKSYDGKKLALSNCNFTLQKGRICAIVGESGSGKSTLLRLIAGLERPENGWIKIKETTVTSDRQILPPQERNVGFVFQDFALFPHLTVAENVAFGVENDEAATVKKMLQLIKMEAYAHAYPSQLSGGQEQRVALARTLATNPELLLLDEPFSNLDAALKSELRQEIWQIVKKIGTSMIFITHDFFDAIDIADEIIFLKDGVVLQHDVITDFSKNIQDMEVKNTLSDLETNAERMLSFLQRGG